MTFNYFLWFLRFSLLKTDKGMCENTFQLNTNFPYCSYKTHVFLHSLHTGNMKNEEMMHVCEARQTVHFLFFSMASLKFQILPSNTKADVQEHCSYVYIMCTSELTSVIYFCIFLLILVWVLQVESGLSFQEGLGCLQLIQ